LANTSRIVERVDAVLATRRVDLETASQQYAERRDRVMTAAIAVGSLIALPPALLLAFFGVNSSDVDPNRSILDVHDYGVAYVIAWLPFLLLIAAGLVARHRTSLRLSAPDTATPAPDPDPDRHRTRRSWLGRSRRRDR
jgi:hypothetical protein